MGVVAGSRIAYDPPSEVLMSVIFQFDYACPYAYIASQRIEALCARVGATVELKPVLLGGIFRALEVPQLLFATLSPAKARHNLQDMHRLAHLWDIPFAMPCVMS